jgi:dipeptidyl aminopeptidase/acylaminoacyl peptidase
MVGLRDGSVPFNGSRRWVQRMHQLGKGHLVDYVEYPDEDHGLSRYRATVRDRILRMERFLEEKLDLR